MADQDKSNAGKRRRYGSRMVALKAQRSSWDAHWRELGDYMLPRRVQLLGKKGNDGRKINDKIINNTPIIAGRALSAGMMAGKTSPARPWFRLTTPDPELAKLDNVKSWLHLVAERIREACAKSNIYNVLAGIYQDLAIFGTAAAIIEEDDEDVIRAYLLPVGTYCLANSARQQVDTIYRELNMTVAQVVEMFTLEKCSTQTQQLYAKGGASLDQSVPIVHVIEPNRERVAGRLDYRGKAWSSCWYEAASSDDAGFLREAGLARFPVLAPRWDLNSEDVYGRSPAMDALGDAKALQFLERQKGDLLLKLVKPPLKGPANLKNQRASILPGDVTYVDEVTGGGKFEPILMVDARGMQFAEASIRETEGRINSALYADLWLMMSSSDRRQITAREIDERHEEKMLQLGPVLERMDDELLDPLLDLFFDALFARGEIPPAPEELQEKELKVEYTSIMAQAQKALGTGAVERLASFGGNLAAADQSVLDKFDFDQFVDEYAGMLGTRPDLIRSDEQVAQMRQAKAQQAQMQAQMAAAQQGAESAKTLSQADTGGDNGLTRLLSGIGLPPDQAGGLVQ